MPNYLVAQRHLSVRRVVAMECAVACLLAGVLLAAGARAAAPRVQLAQGELVGTMQQGVRAFLGIPYAQPPVGALRWRPPQPAKAWQGTRDASGFGPNCMQPILLPRGPWTAEFAIGPSMAEDCLSLNVWAPAQPSARPLPVLVWIHGGSFAIGSGSVPIHNGAALAAQGAVVVTINYRLGVLGFLAHPGLSAESEEHASGNYGLLDMIESLRWVRANIARFGGDPKRVTIAGASAGAMAVVELMASQRARGLFSGAIAESGVLGGPLVPLRDAERDGLALAGLAGLRDVNALRALTPGQVMALQLPWKSADPVADLVRHMRPIIDGMVLLTDPHAPGAHFVNDVPMLTGYNADEGGGIAPRAVAASEFERRVQADFGAGSARLLPLYPHEDDAQADASWRQLDRDATQADVLAWCARRAAAGGRATYVYLFDHVLPGPESDRFRSFHGSEVPYVFGVLDERTRPYRDEDRRVAAVVQGYWLAFIATGSPERPTLPPWPRCSASETQVMGLGVTPAMREAVSTAERRRALQDTAEPP